MFEPDEQFMRDFFRMKRSQFTASRSFLSEDEFIAHAKKHLMIGIAGGRLVIGIKREGDRQFVPLKTIPGSLVAEHIRDKRPLRWWQFVRRWKRADAINSGAG